jgi:hypothetical protein
MIFTLYDIDSRVKLKVIELKMGEKVQQVASLTHYDEAIQG